MKDKIRRRKHEKYTQLVYSWRHLKVYYMRSTRLKYYVQIHFRMSSDILIICRNNMVTVYACKYLMEEFRWFTPQITVACPRLGVYS